MDLTLWEIKYPTSKFLQEGKITFHGRNDTLTSNFPEGVTELGKQTRSITCVSNSLDHH